MHLAEQQKWRESVEEEKKNILHQTRLEMKVVMERVNEKSDVLKEAAEQEALRIIERGKEDVRRAKAENAHNVRVLEAMESFKRTVKKEVQEKLELKEQKRLAKKRLEEAAIKRQRAEASLRAKKEAQRKKEIQQAEAKHSRYMSIESIRTRRMKEEEQKNQIYPAKDYPEGYEYENASHYMDVN